MWKVKSALVEIQMDEYGAGAHGEAHAELFADTMRALGLDPTYGRYLDEIPGVTLATVNSPTLVQMPFTSSTTPFAAASGPVSPMVSLLLVERIIDGPVAVGSLYPDRARTDVTSFTQALGAQVWSAPVGAKGCTVPSSLDARRDRAKSGELGATV